MDLISFRKYQGLGNDFILIDLRHLDQAVDWHSAAKQLCDRNFGIGADGLLLLRSSEHADIRMQIINSDGSEPEMCGNGIRCFAMYLWDQGEYLDTDIHIETMAGLIKASPVQMDQSLFVKVDMGEPILERSKIPVSGDAPGPVIMESILIKNQIFSFTGVSMGNPHAVIFVDDIQAVDLNEMGPIVESHEKFPEQVNVEFVQSISRTEHVMKVWERGAGITLACGTGACAVLVAAVMTDRSDLSATIHLPGGPLMIDWDETSQHIFMTGPAQLVYQGSFEYQV